MNNKIVKIYVPVIILIICLLCLIFPYRSILILNGHPFAKIQKDNIMQYIKTDSFGNKGIVLSKGELVGWISQGWTWGSICFIPLKKNVLPVDLYDDATINQDELSKIMFNNFLLFALFAIVSLGLIIYLFMTAKKYKMT